ncbi:unnamed protein product [Miscanthus lutarioriparius]|uniref:Gnk2-homologous domain-containing protein n=1 Tax=Miscanthus lutarioriparius TaxID=422564 RepID=A0A811P1I3_9POAL|nr:unnamed protein product [Miscanthus lutarioriparius]
MPDLPEALKISSHGGAATSRARSAPASRPTSSASETALATSATVDAENTVYGLVACLADAETSECAACLGVASVKLPGTRCASRRDVVLRARALPGALRTTTPPPSA